MDISNIFIITSYGLSLLVLLISLIDITLFYLNKEYREDVTHHKRLNKSYITLAVIIFLLGCINFSIN